MFAHTSSCVRVVQTWYHHQCVCSVQAAESHANRVRQSSAAQQTQPLNISFRSIVTGLLAGSYQSSEHLKQDVQEICHMAAEVYCSSEQVCHALMVLPSCRFNVATLSVT